MSSSKERLLSITKSINNPFPGKDSAILSFFIELIDPPENTLKLPLEFYDFCTFYEGSCGTSSEMKIQKDPEKKYVRFYSSVQFQENEYIIQDITFNADGTIYGFVVFDIYTQNKKREGLQNLVKALEEMMIEFCHRFWWENSINAKIRIFQNISNVHIEHAELFGDIEQKGILQGEPYELFIKRTEGENNKGNAQYLKCSLSSSFGTGFFK